MKIISTFKDFYDSGLKYGHDELIKYVRKTEPERAIQHPFKLSEIKLPERSWRNDYLHSFLIAGKRYDFHYTSKYADNGLYKSFAEFIKPDDSRLVTPYLVESQDYIDLHREYKSPILRINRYETHPYPTVVTVNPCLRLNDLQKFFNPTLLYQEIEMFIPAYLHETPPMIQISDVMKLQKHGFDKKESFRHRKAG